MTSAAVAIRKFCSAGCRPFHLLDCHIWNHSPPMARKPTPNSSTHITQPSVDSRLALESWARIHSTSAAISTSAVSVSHAMITTYAVFCRPLLVIARHIMSGEPGFGGDFGSRSPAEQQPARVVDAAAGQVAVGRQAEPRPEAADEVRGMRAERLGGFGQRQRFGQLRIEKVAKVLGEPTLRLVRR